MALEEEELEKLREATLRHLALGPVEFLEETIEFEVVATLLGPREEPLEEPMRESLASNLAGRATRVISKKAAGRPVVIVRSKCDYSDHADCEDAAGRQVNAFVAGERCYRIVLRIATARE
jgi:hypothetical protein